MNKLIIVLRANIRFLAGVFAAGLCATGLAIILLPVYYTATTVLIPPQQNQQNNMLASVGAIAGLASASIGGLRSQEEMYSAFLRSKDLQLKIINEFKLRDVYQRETYEETRRVLNGKLSINADKRSGLIYLDIDDVDPIRASKMANAHYAALQELLARIAVTEAQKRRLYFERQADLARSELKKTMERYQKMAASAGGVYPILSADSDAKYSLQLSMLLAQKKMLLSMVRERETNNSDNVKRILSEIKAIESQISTPSSKPSGDSKREGADAVAFEMERIHSTMKLQEAALDVFMKQLEIARADEARDGPLVQQLETATPPEMPSKPRKILLAVAGIFASLLASFCVALWILLSSKHELR